MSVFRNKLYSGLLHLDINKCVTVLGLRYFCSIFVKLINCMANGKIHLVNGNGKLLFKQLKDKKSISWCLKKLFLVSNCYQKNKFSQKKKFSSWRFGKETPFLEKKICSSSFSMAGIIFPHYRNKLCKEHIFCKWVFSRNKLYSGLLHHLHTPWHKQMCHCSRLEETVCMYMCIKPRSYILSLFGVWWIYTAEYRGALK